MQVLAGVHPGGVNDIVLLRHAATTLLVLAPHGILLRDVIAFLLPHLTPAERDNARMSIGVPPVGIDPTDIAYGRALDEGWCLRRFANRLRFGEPDCDCPEERYTMHRAAVPALLED